MLICKQKMQNSEGSCTLRNTFKTLIKSIAKSKIFIIDCQEVCNLWSIDERGLFKTLSRLFSNVNTSVEFELCLHTWQKMKKVRQQYSRQQLAKISANSYEVIIFLHVYNNGKKIITLLENNN